MARPIAADALLEVGSVTKLFSSLLLSDMVHRGDAKFDDPVAAYLPGDVRVPQRAGRDISLLDLSEHLSGLPPMPTNVAPADQTNPYADYGADKLCEFLSSYALPRDNGAEFEYSNVGVALLGHALCRAAGVDFAALGLW